MALSHVCTDCGLELAGFPARVEPVYGWAVVSCPRCGQNHPRREDPRRTAARAAWRFTLAATVLGVNSVCCAFLVLVTAATCRGATSALTVLGVPPSLVFSPGRLLAAVSEVTRARLMEWMRSGDGLLVAPFLCAAALSGLWLELGLSHWRARRRWAAWVAAVVLAAWSLELLGPLNALLVQGGGRPPWRTLAETAGSAGRSQTPMVMISLIPAAVGGLIGHIAVGQLKSRWHVVRRCVRAWRVKRSSHFRMDRGRRAARL